MKIVFHDDFYKVYTTDPASAQGRMEAVIEAVRPFAELITAQPAKEQSLSAVHTREHINSIKKDPVYPIAALAAGGSIQAASAGLEEPSFALIRPPGHHASSSSAWGFCYFNNMAIALSSLREGGRISKAFVLDIDLHYGDGTVAILGDTDWATVYNPVSDTREDYISEVKKVLSTVRADIIGISAGFDHHVDDWGGLLTTEDYRTIGSLVGTAASETGGGCFALLEGGYNHSVLGQNAAAFCDGLYNKTGGVRK